LYGPAVTESLSAVQATRNAGTQEKRSKRIKERQKGLKKTITQVGKVPKMDEKRGQSREKA
jgi:hypothetical protein